MTANVAALTSRSDVGDAEEVQPLLSPRKRKETPLPKPNSSHCAASGWQSLSRTPRFLPYISMPRNSVLTSYQVFPWFNKVGALMPRLSGVILMIIR